MEKFEEIRNQPYNWEIDVAVLCIFFARPEQFQQSFDCVKKVRPHILLLWQDGPRDNRKDDIENINKCRDIVDSINWNCDVYYNYHEKNMGCDPSTFLSHKWAFSIVEKCIILEDDILPSKSFFYFCKELLDKYEKDERIDRICGQTLYGGIPDKRFDYFFGRSGSSWGWASWRRVAETWEPDYNFLNDPYYLDLGRERFGHKRYDKNVCMAKQRRAEGKPYWEYILGFRTTLESGLVIYPRVNMIENCGLSSNATHAPDNLRELPRVVQKMFNTQAEEIQFPLKHPPYIIEDYHYFYKMMKVLSPTKFERFRRRIEHQVRKFYYYVLRRGE